jgi:hypothetical protein
MRLVGGKMLSSSNERGLVVTPLLQGKKKVSIKVKDYGKKLLLLVNESHRKKLLIFLCKG